MEKGMGHGKKPAKGHEENSSFPFFSPLLRLCCHVLLRWLHSRHGSCSAAHAVSSKKTSHRRLNYGCFTSVSTIQGRLAEKHVCGWVCCHRGSVALGQEELAAVSRTILLHPGEHPPGCGGGAGGGGPPFCPKKTSSAGVPGLVGEQDPANPLIKAFNLAPERFPDPDQPQDQTLRCYTDVFFLYFNMSGNSEICGEQFCGAANASSHSRCIQRQQGYP